MRLYYNKWREGTFVQTLWKPKTITDPKVPVLFSGMGIYEQWINMLMGSFPNMTEAQAIEVVAILVHSCIARGYTTKIAMTAAMNVLVERYIATWVATAVIEWAILAASVLLVLAVVLPKKVEGVKEDMWGHGWSTRYREKVWDAKLWYWASDGMPVFLLEAEYGNIIGGTEQNVMDGGVFGDHWFHGLIWQDVKWIWPYWYAMQWWDSFVGFAGYCTRVSALLPAYKLQKQYYGLLPML